jgi:hypothetical protein
MSQERECIETNAGLGNFNLLFAESMSESIGEVLGERVVKSFFQYLEAQFSIEKVSLAQSLPVIAQALTNGFGVAGKILEKRVAKKFYAKLGLTFTDVPQYGLAEYVEVAKKEQAKRESQEKRSVNSLR